MRSALPLVRGHLVGVDDDDVVAAVGVGRELRLVFPTEQVCGLSREAAENDVSSDR